MSDKRRHNLHMVRPDSDEADEKKQKRRRRVRILIVILVIIGVVLIAAYFLMMQSMSYVEYNVTEETERTDSSATNYLSFGEGYVKYSNDGALYVTARDITVWNQSYEMENPIVAVCDSYIAFADRLGETIYVLDETGAQGEISVNMPISKIDVASQGNVAVLMEDSGAGYLSLFDKTGETIAEGAVFVENTGTPMDIALSSDGNNLAASIVDVSTGTARTTINIYNFDTAGQNQIDNLVGTFQYPNTIAPELVYEGDGTLLAFADSGVYAFKGASSPQESGRLTAEDEIQGIFYDDSYFGLIYSNPENESGRVIRVYDTACEEKTSIETGLAYDNISFLNNHEICMLGLDRCDIYNLSGERKFDHLFDEEILAFFHLRGYREYLMLTEDTTERILLKMFPDFGGNRQTENEESGTENTEET